MAFAAGAQNVGAPHEHVARPVGGVIGIFAAHRERPVLQSFHRIFFRIDSSAGCGTHDFERIRLQLRRRRQPAHAFGAHVVIDHAAAVELFVGERREHFLDAELFVAPLVGVCVEEAGRIHLTRRTYPVERESERGPAGLRPQFFLPHIMRPATAAFSHAAAHHQHVDDAAVVHVAVIPVVHGRADDHH